MKEAKVSFYSNENDAGRQSGKPLPNLSFKDGFKGEKNLLLSSGPFQREASKNEIRVNLDCNTSTTIRNFKTFYDNSNGNSNGAGSQYHNTNELEKRSILKILQGRPNKSWKDRLKFISQKPAIQTEKERCEFPGCTKVYSSKHSCRRHFRTKHAKGRTLDDLLPAEGSDQQIQNTSSDKLPIPHSGSKDFSILDSILLRPQLQKRAQSLEPTKRHSIDTVPSDLRKFREELLYKAGRQHNNVNMEFNANNNLNQNVNFVKNKRNSLGSLLEGPDQNLLVESRRIPGLSLNEEGSEGSNKGVMHGPCQQLQSQTSQVLDHGNLPISSQPLIINPSDTCGIFKPTQTLRRRPLSLTEAYRTESSPFFLHPENGISITDLNPSILPPDFYNNTDLLSKRSGNSPIGRPSYNSAINSSYNADLNIYNNNDNKNDFKYNEISGNNYNRSAGLVFAGLCNIKRRNSERGDSNNKGGVLNLIGNISSYAANAINPSDYKNNKDLTFGTRICTYDNSQINNDYNRNCENELAYAQRLNASVDGCNKPFTEFKPENIDKNRNLVLENEKYTDWGSLSSTLMTPSLEFSIGITNPFNTQLLGSTNLGSRAIFPLLEGNGQLLSIDGYIPPTFKQGCINQSSVAFGRPLDQSLQPYNL
ncbi:probable serine/threonine-protein kinase ndrD [Zophobas morio]|uniref:probable serine/threonine-protein kinase ndrD n=1 Tax=Zophobas morio TaxID=2755281 RepID=UPI003083991F